MGRNRSGRYIHSGRGADGPRPERRTARARNGARDPSRRSRSGRGRVAYLELAARVRPSIQRGATRRVEDSHPLGACAQEDTRPRIRADLWSRPHLQQNIAEHDVDDHLAPEWLGYEDIGRLRPRRRRELELDRFWPQSNLDAVLGGDPTRRVDSPISGESERSAVATDVDDVHGRASDELCDEEICRPLVHGVRRAELLEPAGVEHCDAVAHGHGLGLVVGDEDRRHTELLLKRLELRPGMRPELRVEVRERLIHKEHSRLADDGSREGDTLLLAAGELGGPPREEVADAQEVRDPLHFPRLLRGTELADPQWVLDVVAHRHVRVERVALKDEGDVAILGLEPNNALAIDQ